MTGLRDALRQDVTQLHYQPKVVAADGRVAGLEALIRWQDRNGDWIPPDLFVPLAERTDLIHDLTCWVIERACRDLAALHARGLPLALSINLSARNLVLRDLPNILSSALDRHSLQAPLITLEITETAMMHQPKEGVECLRQLRQRGFRIAVDDYGVGYSSLSLLRSLPLDEIKIDRSLLRDLESSPGAHAILESSVHLFHELGFQVVAEGVETAGQAALLTRMGYDTLQGYHFARPMPMDQLTAWLQERPLLEQDRKSG